MFDKFLCEHIHKRTIRVIDVVGLMTEPCILGATLLIGCHASGMIFYEVLRLLSYVDNCPAFGTIGYVINSTAVGVPIMGAIYMIARAVSKMLKIEVAHCPVKDE